MIILQWYVWNGDGDDDDDGDVPLTLGAMSPKFWTASVLKGETMIMLLIDNL